MEMNTHITAFIEAINKAGYSTTDEIIADDEVRRLKVNQEKVSSFSYQLKVDGDLCVGWFRSHKDSETTPYCNKVHLTKKERERAIAIKSEHEKQRQQRKEQAEQVCRQIWQKASSGPEHPYLAKKCIKPHQARLYKGALILPAYRNNKLVSLQFIDACGGKKWKKNAEVAGAYGSVGEIKTDRMWIVEGFATGASVHEATGDMVILAFTAGNLPAIAETMKTKYPDKQFIIAADNDQSKTGERFAKKCGLPYILPPELGDWNDYANKYGLESLKNALQQGMSGDVYQVSYPSDSVPAIKSFVEPTKRPDWELHLKYNSKGDLDKNHLANLSWHFLNHQWFDDLFWYDEFFGTTMFAESEAVVEMEDHHYTQVQMMCEEVGLNKTAAHIDKHVLYAAMQRPKNPAKDYFETLVWDGKPRLATWLKTYMGAHEEPDEYLAFIGTKWLCAGVARVYTPGCKFDHILIIEGRQGEGKSTVLEKLVTFEDQKPFFVGNVNFEEIKKPDIIQKVQGKIIVELSEMVGFQKQANELIKSWITTAIDEARVVYARKPKKYPRKFILAATTNDFEYLSDPSGNRRYWPFQCGAIDLKAIERDKLQLWAEAVHLFKNDIYLGPTEAERALAEEQQNMRVMSDPWRTKVERVIGTMNHMKGFRVEEVMERLGIDMKQYDKKTKRRLMNILKDMGFVNKNKRDENGNQGRLYVKEY